MASWFVRSFPGGATWVRALTRDIVLCSWARHLTLTVPLSTEHPGMGTGEFNSGGNPAMDYHPIQGEVEILLATSCYRNRDTLRPDGRLGSHSDLSGLLVFP